MTSENLSVLRSILLFIKYIIYFVFRGETMDNNEIGLLLDILKLEQKREVKRRK